MVEEKQNRPLHNMAPWHKDYLEIIILKKADTGRNLKTR